MALRPILCVLALLSVPVPEVFGQAPAAPPPDRRALPQTGPPLSLPGSSEAGPSALLPEAVASPGDDDLGLQLLLKRQEAARWWNAYASLGAYWTDNAARVPTAEEEDIYWATMLGLQWQPPLVAGFFLDTAFVQEFYRYDSVEALDFESTEASVGLLHDIPGLDLSLIGLRYGYRRYTEGAWDQDTYSRHALGLTAQKVFLFDRKNRAYAVAGAEWELETYPSLLRRHEYSVQLGFEHRLTHRLRLTAYYRAAWRDYTEGPYDEWNHIAGAGARYELADWAVLEASALWTLNDSDADALDYRASNLGGSVNLRVLF